MHSGRINNSERHQRIIRVFMAADHPLSGEEISSRVQSEIGRIPQAVSTTIGEMRSNENIADGYSVSFACVWRVCRPDEQPGPRPKKDGGYFFLIPETQALPWHDSRPRYWLQAAPGWTSRWSISSAGELIIQGSRLKVQDESTLNIEPETLNQPERLCKNPACRKPISHGHTCDEACNIAWKESIFKKPEGALL